MQKQNNVAVVIGGTGIVGSSIVSSLTKAEYSVAVVSRQLKVWNIQQHNLQGRNVTYHKADFTIESQIRDSLHEIIEIHGRIEVIIYAAGFEPDMDIPLANYPISSWQKTIDTYLTGFFLCFREGLKMISNDGHIVVISSAITRFPPNALPQIYAGHYAAAKAAVNELVKWARREAHQKGVFISRISPGAIDMPFHRNAPLHRRPAKLLSSQVVAEKIVNAIMQKEELDLELVAEES